MTKNGRKRLALGLSAIALVVALFVVWNAGDRTLPARYDAALFTPERGFPEPPDRLGVGPGGRFLIIVPVEGAMAFTTPSNYLGLYDSNGALQDEARLGAFPVELVSWRTDAIVLRAHLGSPGPNTDDVRASAARATRLGPYRIRVLVD